MKRKTKRVDPDMPIGKLIRIPNFLPPPEELVMPGEIVKITISLDQETLLFFKDMAKKLDTKYQRMIREVLRRYVQAYGKRDS